MPGGYVWVTEGTPSATSVPIDVMERASPEIFTTITADPTTGTALAVTDRSMGSKAPQASNFKIRVDNEVMLVTAGFGTGAGSYTVTRGIDGTTSVAHTSGVRASMIVGVPRGDNVDAARQVSFRGRASTFRTPGRAVTTGQKLFAIHNAAGSPVVVDVHHIMIDVMQTVAKLITVPPPVIRIYKFTVVPSAGTALTKVAEDSSLTSKTQVTVWGDASADGTASTTTLAVTGVANGQQTGMLTQMFAPRIAAHAAPTASSINPFVELMDRATFFDGETEIISLQAAEGVAIHLDFTLATQNPATDMWTATLRWEEYAPA